jgi:membrane protein implicated in regulation of membrane protease activity
MVGVIGETLAILLLLGGAGLLAIEAIAPGSQSGVAGIGMLTAGIVGILLPADLGIWGPVVLALLVLGVTIGTLVAYRQLDIYGGEGAAETINSESLDGMVGTVTERVTPMEGQIKLSDAGFNPYFEARTDGEDIDVGTEVVVVDPGGGNVVAVEPVGDGGNADPSPDPDADPA